VGKKLNSLPSVKKTLGKLSSLPCAKNNTLGKEFFAEYKKTLGKLASLSSGKNNTLGKEFFAECIYFAECFYYDTRQRSYLMSARKNTLGKGSGTRQRSIFP